MKKPLIYASKVDLCQFFIISSACSLQNSKKGNILNKSLEKYICLQQLQSWSRNFLSLSPMMFFKRSMYQKSSIKTRSSAIEVSIEKVLLIVQKQALNIRFDLPTLNCRSFDFTNAANMRTSYFQLILFP